MRNFYIVFIVLFSVQINAAEFCVSTSDELQNALSLAQNNGQNNHIKLMEGTFNTSDNNAYPNDIAFFRYYAATNNDLTISGGWITFFDTPCGFQFKNPNNTILDGDFNSKVMSILMQSAGDLTIEYLTFQRATTTSWGGGLQVYGVDPITDGKLLIQNNMFVNNTANYGSAMSLRYYDEIIVKNNFFLVNHANQNHTVYMSFLEDAYGVFFINNTVYANTTDGSYADVYIFGNGTTQIMVANNIINNNEGRDLSVDPYYGFFLKNNNLGQWRTGLTPVEESGNISLPNRFESGLLNFVPDSNSPLVNAGLDPCPVICQFPPPFKRDWNSGELDVSGNVRVQQDQVDIGAFESSHERDLIFWGPMENL